MKTMRRLVITQSKVTQLTIDEQMAASKIMAIPNQLKIETEFASVPNILDGSVKRDGGEYYLSKVELQKKVNKLDYHWIHVVLTDEDWKNLKLEPRLYGSSSVLKGQVITFGRWHERSKYQNSHRYESPVRELPESSIGTWHEGTHGFARLFGLYSGKNALAYTHTFFYGYNRLYKRDEEKKLNPKRWQKTPQPILGWRALPWGRLPDIETKKAAPVEKYSLNLTQKLLDNRGNSKKPQWFVGNSPKSLILHTTLGDDSGLGSWAWLDEIELSYHFIVAADGKVYQLTPFGMSAWHAGVTRSKSGQDLMSARARAFFGNVNPNKMSIGIAFARNGQTELTDAQKVASVALIKYIGQHTGVYYSAENVFAHHETCSWKPREVLGYRTQVLDALAGERDPEPAPEPVVTPAPVPSPFIDTAETKELIIKMLDGAKTLVNKL